MAKGPHWTRGCLALLTSKTLKEWSLEPEPFYAPNDMMCPECLEFFSLPNGKWYLIYSRFSAPNAGTVYRVADSPRGPFRTPRDGSGGRLDGRRWYAAKSCQKANDASKRIFFGWVADQVRIWEQLPRCFRPRSVLTNVQKRLLMGNGAGVVTWLCLGRRRRLGHQTCKECHFRRLLGSAIILSSKDRAQGDWQDSHSTP